MKRKESRNMYQINFQKAKRNFMTLTFEDEKPDGTPHTKTICVGMPKKRIFDRLMDLSDMVHNDDDEPQSQREKSQKNRQQIDALYSVTADILSNNLAREKITAEWVGEMMDVQDLKDFLQEYAKFAKQEAANPN
jgi:hypothetical protein